MYPECGIMVFRGQSPRNSIIPHEGYNPYTLENHSTADFSLVPRRSEGRGERTPGTHCLRMHLISEISRKIGYFSNPPCNDDV